MAYIYQDIKTALVGTFKKGLMVRVKSLLVLQLNYYLNIWNVLSANNKTKIFNRILKTTLK